MASELVYEQRERQDACQFGICPACPTGMPNTRVLMLNQQAGISSQYTASGMVARPRGWERQNMPGHAHTTKRRAQQWERASQQKAE